MLCAMELLQVKERAEKEYQEEQARLEMECAVELVKAVERTIRFCEEVIGKELEDKAKERKAIVAEYEVLNFTDRLNNEMFKLLEVNRRYSNGEPSKAPAGEKYSLTALKEYLEAHCLKVEVKKFWFKHYGAGEQRGTKIIVSIE